MQRPALLALSLIAIALISTAAWQHHHHRAAELARRQAEAAPAPAQTAQTAPSAGRAIRGDGQRPPLGAEPTHDEIEHLLRQQAAELEKQGGIPVALSQTGQRLPDMHIELRAFRFPQPCAPVDAPTEHPHWHCHFEVELFVPRYDKGFHWDPRDIDFARYRDGGIGTLEQVVRVERGLATR